MDLCICLFRCICGVQMIILWFCFISDHLMILFHFQTSTHVCLITDFCPGGELFALLDKQPMKIFTEDSARYPQHSILRPYHSTFLPALEEWFFLILEMVMISCSIWFSILQNDYIYLPLRIDAYLGCPMWINWIILPIWQYFLECWVYSLMNQCLRVGLLH